jgi:hypothetical protein
MNHTSQKWREFGGFSQLRSPLTSSLIGAAASAGKLGIGKVSLNASPILALN